MKLLSLPEGIALSFDPPSIPGMGATGGFEFQIEDLTGRGSAALNDALQAVLAEARKQPELNAQGRFSPFSNSTPQFKYDLDRNYRRWERSCSRFLNGLVDQIKPLTPMRTLGDTPEPVVISARPRSAAS